MAKNQAALTDGELEITPLQWQALAKLGDKAKQFRSQVPVLDAQAVDFVIKITGDLNVADGTTYRVQDKPDLQTLLGIVLTGLGPKTREKALEQMVALGRSEDAGIVAADVAAEVSAAIAKLTIVGSQTRSGAISGNITAELIGSKSG